MLGQSWEEASEALIAEGPAEPMVPRRRKAAGVVGAVAGPAAQPAAMPESAEVAGGSASPPEPAEAATQEAGPAEERPVSG